MDTIFVIDRSDIVDQDRLRECLKRDRLLGRFWNLYKSTINAERELLQFCDNELKDLTEAELIEIFGDKWCKAAKRWINSELVVDRYGRDFVRPVKRN